MINTNYARYYFAKTGTFIAISTLCLITGCTSLFSFDQTTTGSQLFKKNVDLIIEGTTTRDELQSLLGKPLFIVISHNKRSQYWVYEPQISKETTCDFLFICSVHSKDESHARFVAKVEACDGGKVLHWWPTDPNDTKIPPDSNPN